MSGQLGFYELRTQLHSHLQVKKYQYFVVKSMMWLCRSDPFSFSMLYSQITDLNLTLCIFIPLLILL